MYRLGLIGYPIQHSLSPWIHQHFLEKTKLEGTYELFEFLPSDSFANEIQKLKSQNLDGFNVTVPYKQKIIPYLDKIDPEARRVGAVNTVVLKDGQWVGYNTDGRGYIRSLKNNYPNLFHNVKRNILILGAGGAARGIYDAIANEGFERVDIANRTLASAKDIVRLRPDNTETKTLTLDEVAESLGQYDAIIQTTSVGMSPHVNDLIIPLNKLSSHTIMSDIVYQPIKTRFLKESLAIGASIHLGHTMLLYQAQYAFEIWTGEHVPIDSLEKSLRKQLMEGQ